MEELYCLFVVPCIEPFTTEVILLVCNMNLREFITENQPVALTAKLQALWSDTNSHAVITKLESFADKGRPIPIPPGQEGYIMCLCGCHSR